MGHGGARAGAGRPREVARAAAQLDKVRDKLHAEFYLSAGMLAQAMPQLTQLAIKAATGYAYKDKEGKDIVKLPDLNILKFLMEQFWKIVGAMPGDENSKAKEMRAQFLAIVNNYTNDRPQIVGADSGSRVIEAEIVSDTGDEGSVLRPSTN